MYNIQITGAEDYGKPCCFIDDNNNKVYGKLSFFAKAISNNPNEKDIYMRENDNKIYRLAYKTSLEESEGIE